LWPETLPVESGRRRGAGSHPVQHHVVEQLIATEDVLGVSVAVGPRPELLQDPGRLSGRRVREAIPYCLWAGRLLLGITGIPVPLMLDSLERSRFFGRRLAID